MDITSGDEEQHSYGTTDSRRSSEGREPFEMNSAPAPLSKLRVLGLNIAWLGLSTTFLVMSVVVVPAQMESMVGSKSKGRWLGGMVAGGAVLMFITGPLVGMLSDRLTSPYGRRRPVILGSTMLLCLGLIGMGLMAPRVHLKRHKDSQGNCQVDLEEQRCLPYRSNVSVKPILPNGQVAAPPVDLIAEGPAGLDVQNPTEEQQIYTEELSGHITLYIMFYLLVACTFTASTVPLSGLVADKSHPAQRGLNSGVMGFMILFGNISGATLGLFFLQLGVIGIYSIVSTAVIICVLITVVTTTENPGKPVHVPLDIISIFSGFWAPLKERDFRWVFITRFLMQQGISTVTGFLEYWLADMVVLPHCWSPERSVAMMMVPLLGTAAVGCLACGAITDRLSRRKLLVSLSAFTMCAMATVLAFIRGEYAYYMAISLAFVFGLAFGCFQAVDFALVMDVLPDEKDKAKDIAVWHQALILPQAIATPIAGLLLDYFERVNCSLGLGYIIVFVVTAVYFFLSGLFVRNIKGVR